MSGYNLCAYFPQEEAKSRACVREMARQKAKKWKQEKGGKLDGAMALY